MTKRKIIRLILLIGILVFVILEILFRSRYKTQYYHPAIFQYDSILGYKFIPNFEFETSGNVIRFNKYGYRGNNWTIEKDTGIYRIALVGSCALTGALHIKDTTTYCYPELSNQFFNKNNIPIEVLNFGITGEERNYYLFKSIESEIIRFNPDLVLFEFNFPYSAKHYIRTSYKGYQLEYANNQRAKEIAKSYVENLEKMKSLQLIYNNCYTLKAIGRNYCYRNNNELSKYIDFIDKHKITLSDEVVSGFYTLDRSLELFNDLMEKIKEKDISFYYFVYHENKNILNISNEYNLPLLNLDCDFVEDMFYPRDSHLNNLGQVEIAKQFIKVVEEIHSRDCKIKL